MNLQQAAQKLVKKHGSQSAAARAVQISQSYMNVLVHGGVRHPGPSFLRRLGLKVTKNYEFVTRH